MGTHARHRVVGFAAAGFAIALGASLASAQTQPTPPGGARPTAENETATQYVSPYWSNGPQSGQPMQTRETPATPDDLMNTTVLAVPVARAQAVGAEMQFRRLDSLLNRTTGTMLRDFRESDDYTNAVEALREAHAEYDRARNEAISGLKETEDYQAAMMLHSGVHDQILKERESDRPDAQRLLALAELKLAYVAPLRTVEREQIEASDDVRSARERLGEAAARMRELERTFTRDHRDNSNLAELRTAREDAKIAMRTTQAFLYEMRSARRIAVNYAYTNAFLKYDAQSNSWGGYYGSPYYGGGASYGYGYPTVSYGYYGR